MRKRESKENEGKRNYVYIHKGRAAKGRKEKSHNGIVDFFLHFWNKQLEKRGGGWKKKRKNGGGGEEGSNAL